MEKPDFGKFSKKCSWWQKTQKEKKVQNNATRILPIPTLILKYPLLG